MQPDVFSSPVIKRYNGGKPVLSKEDIPYPATLFSTPEWQNSAEIMSVSKGLCQFIQEAGRTALIYGFPNRPICGFGENPVF